MSLAARSRVLALVLDDVCSQDAPRGVSRAFLCTFIRSSRESLKPRNSSFLGQDRVDNLMKAHS